MRWRRVVGTAALVAVGACGHGMFLLSLSACHHEQRSSPQSTASGLPPGVVARVGDQDVAALTVARIASARDVPLNKARDLAVEDAVFAAAADDELPASRTQEGRARVLARALLRQLWLDARDAPITDAELAEATDAFWTVYDRPKGYRVVHAVVMPKKKATPADREEAKAFAQQVLEAVQPAAELARSRPLAAWDDDRLFRYGAELRGPASKKFTGLVKELATPKGAPFEVRAEELPPMTVDGVGIVKGTNRRGNTMAFDAQFAKAAAALDKRGDMTGVVETPFGYHVIMLLEITPPRHASKAKRLEGLHDEILRVRAKRAQRKLLQQLRASSGVEVVGNSDALLGQLDVVGSKTSGDDE